jgi:transposase InsO family protein
VSTHDSDPAAAAGAELIQALLTRTVQALKTAGVAVNAGCLLVGLPRSTFYRCTRGYRHYRPVAAPIAHRDRRQPAALSTTERAVITEVLGTAEYADLSVQQTYWRALDAGSVACSERTFYRVANDQHMVGDRRRRRTSGGGGSRNKPIVNADKVGDLWSWDITELRGPRTQDRYKLYLALDVFSRYPVAWSIEYTEETALVVQMFQQAFTEHGVPAVLHADNGSSMRANELIQAIQDAGSINSYSRPRVSDDNPFSESLFKTIKYDLTCPDTFDNIDHARTWTGQFLHGYAHHHRHSGIGHYTPASVHDGTAHTIQQRRQDTLDRYYQQHPERFTKPPKAPALPKPTGINTQLSQTA